MSESKIKLKYKIEILKETAEQLNKIIEDIRKINYIQDNEKKSKELYDYFQWLDGGLPSE